MTDRLVRALLRLAAIGAATLIAAQVAVGSAAAAAARDDVEDVFLVRLLEAINARRERSGTQHLSFVPAGANAALGGFLDEAVRDIAWPSPCMHQVVHGAFSWDVVAATGFGGDPRGEVLACPGPEPYWTADGAAEQWWSSPIHFDILYGDGESNAIACSAYGVRGTAAATGKSKRASSASVAAASAILCVTFRA